MRSKTSILTILFILMMVVPLFTQAQLKDEYGVKYSSDGMAKTISGKRDQLFRVINMVRAENNMPPLVYKVNDQKLADKRVKELVRNFKADTATCKGEVVYKGTFGDIVSLATSFGNESNFQYLSDVEVASIAVYRKGSTYYTIIRTF